MRKDVRTYMWHYIFPSAFTLTKEERLQSGEKKILKSWLYCILIHFHHKRV